MAVSWRRWLKWPVLAFVAGLVLSVISMSMSCDPGGSAGPDAAPPGDDAATPPAGHDASMPPPGDDVPGCAATSRFLPLPADISAPGPWPVGARTVGVGRLTVEVFYPARPGSDAGLARTRYDIRLQLPASERAKIPDAENPWQPCEPRRRARGHLHGGQRRGRRVTDARGPAVDGRKE